jgi:hypothetical protein
MKAVEVIRISGPVPVTQLAIWEASAIRNGIAHEPVMIELLESDGNDDRNLDVLWRHFFALYPSCHALISTQPEGPAIWLEYATTKLRAGALRHFSQA